MDFYRNILFVFPKEKCLPATFVDLQKKSNSARDSNSVLQILHQGESMLLRYVKFTLKFPKFCFYCDNKRQGGDPFPFHCLVGFAFSTCLFNLEICHCPFQLFRQILTDAERKTMDISVAVNCTKKRLETVELITTQCRQNKLFFSFETAQTWILIKSALKYVISISCSLLNFYRSEGK